MASKSKGRGRKELEAYRRVLQKENRLGILSFTCLFALLSERTDLELGALSHSLCLSLTNSDFVEVASFLHTFSKELKDIPQSLTCQSPFHPCATCPRCLLHQAKALPALEVPVSA